MLKGNNLFSKVKPFVAIEPQSVGQATVNGTAIAAPQKWGRQIMFVMQGGTFGTSVAATCTVEYSTNGGSSYAAVDDKDGNDLVFTASKLADAGTLEHGYLLGTLDLSMLHADTTHIRLTYVQATGAVTALIACMAYVFDLYTHGSGETDDLFSKTFPPAEE